MSDTTNPATQEPGKPGNLETIARLAYEMATHENARKTRRLERLASISKSLFSLPGGRVFALNYAATASALALARGLARGIDDPETAEADLLELLRRAEWHLDRKTDDRMSPDDFRYLAEELLRDLATPELPRGNVAELEISDSPWASLKTQLAATPPVGAPIQMPPDAPTDEPRTETGSDTATTAAEPVEAP